MTSSIIMDFAIGMLGAVCLLAGVALFITLWAMRRWKKFKLRIILRSHEFAVRASETPVAWLLSLSSLNRSSVAIDSSRRRMNRSVSNAQRAVEMTIKSDSANGDLISLCQRLAQARENLDRSLIIAQRSSSGLFDRASLSQQADTVTKAANQIEHAASAAILNSHRDTLTDLIKDTNLEFDAITRAMDAASTAWPLTQSN